MVKVHNCLVKINNGTESDMMYVGDWYKHGRLGDGFSWPEVILPGQDPTVLSYERDWSWIGCSGYVTYKMFDTDITIAFSNPATGRNKLGVGTDGKDVWSYMTNHGYKPFTVAVICSDEKQTVLQFHCQCTGGKTNTCTVNVEALHPSS